MPDAYFILRSRLTCAPVEKRLTLYAVFNGKDIYKASSKENLCTTSRIIHFNIGWECVVFRNLPVGKSKSGIHAAFLPGQRMVF